MDRGTRTSWLLAFALTALAATFLGSFALIYRHYRSTLVEDERRNQLKVSQMVAQSLDLYFDKLKYITDQAVNTGVFASEDNGRDDALRFARIPLAQVRRDIERYRPAVVLEGARQPFAAGYAPTEALASWQLYKGLPERDASGRPIAAERRKLARSILNTFPDLHYAFEMELNGDLVFLEPFEVQKDISSFNYEFRDYLQLIKRTRRTVISEGYVSHDLNRTRIITVATPIFDRQNRIVKLFAVSVSAAVLRERVFQSLKESMNVTDGTVFYLVDRHGHVVASSNGRNIYYPVTGKSDDHADAGNLREVGFFKDLEWRPDLLEKGNIFERDSSTWTPAFLAKEYFGQYRNLAGETVFGTFLPKTLIPGEPPSVGILVETPVSRFRDAADHLNGILMVSGAALLLLVAAIAAVILRGFGRLRADLMETEREIHEVQREVFHNIGSPLTALESVAPQLGALPEGTRILIRNALQNIRDVVNGLRSNPRRRRTAGVDREIAENVTAPQLIFPLAEHLLSEKRLEYRKRPGLRIEFATARGSHGAFASVNPSELRVVLSNLINNAADAITGEGRILLRLSTEADRVRIVIEDTGRGIPATVVARLNDRPFSFGKKGGSGVGLRHAKKNIESWGGQLRIDSRMGNGTAVGLELVGAPTPAWFADEIAVPAAGVGTVVVLDDDPGIHAVWARRLSELRLRPSLCHLRDERELREYVASRPTDSSDLFLVDYELGVGQPNGLALIRELGLSGPRSILITSRWDEEVVLDAAIALGVRVLPKSMAPVIPVSSSSAPSAPMLRAAEAPPSATETPDCVLIDDDPVTQMSWNHAGLRAGKRIRVYTRAADFLAEQSRYVRATPIYIDSLLGEHERGERIARQIHALGFGQIELVTGLPPESFPPMPWIRAIRGKEPPWMA